MEFAGNNQLTNYDLSKVKKLFSAEQLKRKVGLLGTTPMAFILAACGGGSSTTTTTTTSNVLSLTKSGDAYSVSSVTGFSVSSSAQAKFDVSDATSNAYSIKLDASGTGALEFDFADSNDTVTLLAGSKTTGFTTLKVTDGTLDATDADLTGITRVEVASGIKVSLAQIKAIPTIVANSATSEITVEIQTEAEATEFVSLISAGTITVYGDTNPIKLVAAPTATVTTDTLTAKQAETTSSVKTTSELDTTTVSVATTSVAELLIVQDNAGTVEFGGPATGDITISWAGTPGSSEGLFTRQGFTAETGIDFSSSKTINITSAQSLAGTAANLDALTITNAGTVTVTASAGDQSMTVSGGTVKAAMGDGTDSFDFGVAANVTIADEFDGGNGTDTVKITADNNNTGAIFDDAGAKFDVLKINDGTSGHNVKVTLDFGAADSVVRTIDASDMDASSEDFTLVLDTAENVDGALTIKASGGKNIVAGGDGDDTLDFGITAVTADDEINLGSGTDEVKITALGTDATNPTDMVFDNAGAGWEKLTISPSTATAAFDSTVSLDFTGTADEVAREIDASGLVAATQIFTLEMSAAAKVAGALTVTGGAAADSITTGAGDDTVKGGAGGDTLNGGDGTDKLDLSDLVIGDADGGIAINASGSDVTGSAGTLEFSKGDTTAAYATLADGKVAYTSDTSETLNTDIDTVSNFESYETGDGDDRFYGGTGSETFTAGDGADFANAGTGADTLNMGDGADTVVIAGGDTVLTVSLGDSTTASSVSGYDVVTGLVRSSASVASEVLDLVGSGVIEANSSSTNVTDITVYTDASDTSVVIGSLKVAAGIASFHTEDDSSDDAIVVSADNLAGVIELLQDIDLGSGGDTLAFAFDNTGDGTAESLMVFQQGVDDGTDSKDILVLLEGQGSTDALIITTNTVGANDLFIA